MPKGIPGKITIVCKRCRQLKIHCARGLCDACWQVDRFERLRAQGNFYVPTPKTKVCQRCHKRKSVSHFPKYRNSRDGLQAWCRECISEQYHLYRANPEWVERERKRARDVFNNLTEDQKREKHNRDYEHEKERLRIDPEYKRRKNRQSNWKNQKRDAIRWSLTEHYTLEEWEALCKKYDYLCLACKKHGLELTVDHVIPISRGGKDTIDNIQPLCRSCNSKKNNKHIDYR